MPVTRTASSSRSRLHADPIAYANRSLEPEFDPYLAVREHVAKLVIEPRPIKRPVSACPAA